jgi:polysaccharide export outer membrane protein
MEERVSLRPNLRVAFMVLLGAGSSICLAANTTAGTGAAEPLAAVAGPLMPLGPQDSVTIHIDEDPITAGPPTPVTVADDGMLRVPYVGAVPVAGLSPDAAARRVEKALKDRNFFVNPHVTITMLQSLSQRVSVLGEVKTPGRYPVDARTSIVDLIAQAGGFTELSADVIYVSRTDSAGNVKKFSVNMRGLNDPKNTMPEQVLRGGDSVYVPRADQFFILGEVQKPAMYKLEPNMTVLQAISVAGGITLKGSDRRVEIKRPGKNGADLVIKAKANDLVQPGDVIRVKESIF